MRFKSLSTLTRPELREVALATLPRHIAMTTYAAGKAARINELVRTLHGESLEWYGFTLGAPDKPDCIVDIGLPQNDLNLKSYTALSSERIAAFQETLPETRIINGWIHSHGELSYKHFSLTDEANHRVVMDFVSAGLRIPIAKREVAIKDLVFLLKDRFVDDDLAAGSVCLITDAPVREAMIMEAIYGSFCFAIVVGDDGWHEQEIHTREYGILSGHTHRSKHAGAITLIDTERIMDLSDLNVLRDEVTTKIRPNTNPPVETMERM